MILNVTAGSSWWLFAAANLILFLHITGGTVGIVSGAVALVSRKGGRLHRVSGTIFFVSMLIMATIGAAASPFLPVPSMPNVAAGTLTLYLVATGWVAIKQQDGHIGRFERGGLGVASGIVATAAIFILMAMNSPTGTIGNTPPQAFFVFALVGAIAAAGDLKMILRGGLSGSARIARHLWRMSAALTIASGSFFLGQQRIMPGVHAGIALALRSGVCAVAVDGLLADPRSTHAVAQESEIPTREDRPAVFPIKTIAMKRVLRVLRFCLWSVLVIVGLGGVLFGYYVYTPPSEMPQLSGTLTKGFVEVGGLKRTYTTYVPRGLAKGAPLVLAMHGSGENAAQMRIATGYGFDRLADEHRFAVVYPNGYEGYWNGCNIVGDYSANTLNIDDVAFLGAVADKLITEIGVDPGRVFAMGVSRGASMALRLALEAPSHFRAVAAVSENMPTPENFKCRPAGHGTSSVMVMNGTEDPLVPFDGGDVNLFGVFVKRGKVVASRVSGQYFADLNHIAGAPRTNETDVADGVRVEHVLWRNDSKVEVELVAIHGGGHGMPQPYRRHPRLLGPSPKEPNGPEVIWAFFERQRL